MYGDSDEESVADLDTYLEQGYSSMSDVSWYDSHLNLSEGWGLYSGYWAIEAAAIAFILELYDTTLHRDSVFPKDLVDFARSFKPSPLGGSNRNLV